MASCEFRVDNQRILKLRAESPCALSREGGKNHLLPSRKLAGGNSGTSAEPGNRGFWQMLEGPGNRRFGRASRLGRRSSNARKPSNRRVGGAGPREAPPTHTWRSLVQFPPQTVPGHLLDDAQLIATRAHADPRRVHRSAARPGPPSPSDARLTHGLTHG
jgi:hypothetical protein